MLRNYATEIKGEEGQVQVVRGVNGSEAQSGSVSGRGEILWEASREV